MKLKLIGFSISLLLMGCVKTDILRHYASNAPGTDEDSKRAVEMFQPNGFVTAPDQRATLLLDRLSDYGQLAYIKAVSATYTKPSDAVIAAASAAVQPSRGPCGWADLTTKQVKIVLSLSGAQARPADRFEELRFSLTRTTSDYKFVSWDRFDTVYATINLGSDSVSRDNKVGFGRDSNDYTANVPATITPDASLFRVFGESSVRRTESASYAARKAAVNGVLESTRATIFQQGAPHIDLIGNTIATMSLRAKALDNEHHVAFRIQKLFENNEPIKAASVSVETCKLTLPANTASDWESTVEAKGRLRLVIEGDETFRESDDVVRVVDYAEKGSTVTLVPAAALQYQLHAIVKPNDPKRARLGWRQHNGPEGVIPMLFLDQAQAKEMLAWLQLQPKTPTELAARGLVVIEDDTPRPVRPNEFNMFSIGPVSSNEVASYKVL